MMEAMCSLLLHFDKTKDKVIHVSAMKAYGEQGNPLILNLSAMWVWVVRFTQLPRHLWERIPVLTEQEAGWVPRAGLDILEKRNFSCRDSIPALSSQWPSLNTYCAALPRRNFGNDVVARRPRP